MRKSAHHVELLDHVRGIAILAVLLFHALGMAFGYDALPWKGWLRDFSVPTSFLCFLPVGFMAQAGVAIFFVVSGFCIHTSFQQQGRQWGSFFVRRFFRIYPAYLLALIFSVAILMINPGLNFQDPEFWKQLLSHVFLVHNLFPSTVYGINASLWSLAVEAQLYLLYPVLLLLANKMGWRTALTILAGCELLIRATDGLTQTFGVTDTAVGHIVRILADLPLGFWFSWGMGAFIAKAFLNNEPLPFRNVPVTLCLLVTCACYFAKPLYVFEFPLFAWTTAAFISRRLSNSPEERKSPASLAKVLTYIGLWSYSIYLLHQPLFHVYSRFFVWAIPPDYRPAPIGFLLLLLTLAVIIPFSFLWYRTIEIPGIALGKSITQRLAGEAQGRQRTANVPAKTISRAAYAMMAAGLVIFICGNLFVSYTFSVRAAMRKNELAWMLATSPDFSKRDGARAVKMAEDICLQTQYRYADMIGTLAAAYAEAGRFDEAVGAAQMACTLASQSGDKQSLQKYETMVELFRRHEPFRETSANDTNRNGFVLPGK